MCGNRNRATCGRRNNGHGCGASGQGCCGRNNCNNCSSVTHLNGCARANISSCGGNCGRNNCTTCMPNTYSRCGRVYQSPCGFKGGCGSRPPLALTLGKMAYDKYQEHQAQKQQPIQPEPTSPARSLHNSDEHLNTINSEVLKNAGIEPPSYDAAMKQPSPAPRVRRADSVISASSGSSSSSSSEVIFTPPTTVADPTEERDQDLAVLNGNGERSGSKKDMKKAYKAARKAEKWAAKARERGWVFEN